MCIPEAWHTCCNLFFLPTEHLGGNMLNVFITLCCLQTVLPECSLLLPHLYWHMAVFLWHVTAAGCWIIRHGMISKSHVTGCHLAQLVEWASHVLRLCSGPGFDSCSVSLCCVSLSLSLPVSCHSPSLSLFPVTLFSCTINKGQKNT